MGTSPALTERSCACRMAYAPFQFSPLLPARTAPFPLLDDIGLIRQATLFLDAIKLYSNAEFIKYF